ncbi:hypothetical protein [Nocardia goodfellowii]|uniref:Uncharacterized protein n=1 Tax=Nocardia goodfellowii TaxID=882446 RepID=A0ABS4QEF7_9NOCA|nr:hypothetical protein [Nocardia goodfellowii]MBP2190047.1 hypothetical protein [Nocardia goodfellowii]
MSSVAIALIGGFLCCALLIRALGARSAPVDRSAFAVPPARFARRRSSVGARRAMMDQ